MRMFLIGLLLAITTSACFGADRPNVVWIVSEDNSIHYLDHFFPGGAKAPNIEALASEGLTFRHAFSNAPVCSVARTTLATGCYGPRIGTQFHRRYKLAEMPPGLRMFPAYLRDAGYFTTNNSKKDYNAVEGPGVWDESSRTATWRNRPDSEQPFFHMESHGQSHESSLHFGTAVYEGEKTQHNPDDVALADYFPDTPLFRYTHAHYLDRMQVIDEIVGNTVSRLKEDGLLEDTFIFYFGDHGGVLPRGKGYAYESGLHVPLVVRIPGNFQHLVDAEAGDQIDGFVSFIDFGPSVLNLAGVGVPDQMDGKPFLGAGVSRKELDARDETYGYADRFDEKYDLIRTVRKGKFTYLRCYQPWLPDGLMNIYRYKMLAYKEWQSLWKSGSLKGAARQFYEPRAVELLFDVERDPHEINNLAADPEYASVLSDLRGRLQRHIRTLPDLSMFPESYLVRHALDQPVAFGEENKERIARLLKVADLQLLPYDAARGSLRTALGSDDPLERYWGVMVCSAFGTQAVEQEPLIRALLKDETPVVRIRAAEFLGIVGKMDPQPFLTELVNTTEDAVLAVEALNSVVYFRDFYGTRYPVARSDFNPVTSGGDVDDRLNYLNGVPYPPKVRQQNKRRGN